MDAAADRRLGTEYSRDSRHQPESQGQYQRDIGQGYEALITHHIAKVGREHSRREAESRGEEVGD